jgi:hypothetical protein
MSYTQADLDMANRHVAEGERHVAEQEARITLLRMHGHPTTDAEELLATFLNTLAAHRSLRSEIEASLK